MPSALQIWERDRLWPSYSLYSWWRCLLLGVVTTNDCSFTKPVLTSDFTLGHVWFVPESCVLSTVPWFQFCMRSLSAISFAHLVFFISGYVWRIGDKLLCAWKALEIKKHISSASSKRPKNYYFGDLILLLN